MKALIRLLILAADMIYELTHKETADLKKVQKIEQVIYAVCGAKLRYGKNEISSQELNKVILEVCEQYGLNLPEMSADSKLD